MSIIDLTWLRIAHPNFRLVGGGIIARGLDGRGVAVSAENRRWVGQLELPAMSEVQARHMRAAGARLQGVANAMRLAVPAGVETPWSVAGGIAAADVDRALDLGVGVDEGALVALDPVAASSAARGASVIEVAGGGVALQIGAYFTIADSLYLVESVAGGVVQFSPPLRQAVAGADRIRACRPLALFRLADPDQWQVMQDYGRLGRPMTVKVEEVFPDA